MRILIDLHFLPSLEYFCALSDFNEILIERNERFVKQSYRNRCFILTSQRVEMLSVPLSGRHAGILFRDVKVDYTRSWQPHMWRTIMSAYRNSPFYEHYAGDLEAILSKKHVFAYDLNMEALTFLTKALKWNKAITETSTYEVSPPGVVDLRKNIDSREQFVTRKWYRPVPYYQVFGTAFSPNLSLIDLIFCKGPEAGEILAASAAKKLE